MIAAQQWGNDLDLFLSHRLDSIDERGGEVWTEPRPLDGLNSTADEVFPRWEGQDVTFASNRTGAFRVYDASSALQLLRATPREDVPAGMEEVLSVVTVGPGFSWVTGRLSKGTPLAVTRWDWPQAASPIPEGWTVCVTMADQTEVAGTLVVRAMDTREVVRTLNLDADGCASLKGLPADKSWAFKWRGRPDHPPQMSSEAIADIRSPDGRLVRRYTLSAKKGWSFVMLPLDAIQALSELRRVDDSEWPKATFALLNYAHGAASPLASSLRTFKAWAKQVDVPLNPGHWSVVGHADASGSSHDNDRLSLRRAQLIASFLVDEMGWPRASVEVRAAGNAEPLGEDPAQNRRVGEMGPFHAERRAHQRHARQAARLTVTQADLNYIGSISLDPDLIEAAELGRRTCPNREHQQWRAFGNVCHRRREGHGSSVFERPCSPKGSTG